MRRARVRASAPAASRLSWCTSCSSAQVRATSAPAIQRRARSLPGRLEVCSVRHLCRGQDMVQSWRKTISNCMDQDHVTAASDMLQCRWHAIPDKDISDTSAPSVGRRPSSWAATCRCETAFVRGRAQGHAPGSKVPDYAHGRPLRGLHKLFRRIRVLVIKHSYTSMLKGAVQTWAATCRGGGSRRGRARPRRAPARAAPPPCAARPSPPRAPPRPPPPPGAPALIWRECWVHPTPAYPKPYPKPCPYPTPSCLTQTLACLASTALHAARRLVRRLHLTLLCDR